MKKLFYPALAVALFAAVACNKTTETNSETTASTETAAPAEGNSYGEKITADGAVPVAELESRLGDKQELAIKVKGEIEEVCQMKGCWVTLKMPNGEPMRVMFGEDEFFVPKDVSGKTAIVEGVALKEIIPVDEQRHYLEDAGKSKAEIEAITQPDTTLTFNAKGIIIL